LAVTCSARRDKIAIMLDLLNNIQEPMRLTHLLYKSNMSYSQLIKYLDTLKQLGLIQQQEKPHRVFMITDDGRSFVNLLRKDQAQTVIPV